MKASISKWGNSLAVRIPSPFAREIHIEEGSEVDISISEGRLIIRPIEPQSEPKYDLEEILAGITPDNLHGQTDWHGPIGNELW